MPLNGLEPYFDPPPAQRAPTQGARGWNSYGVTASQSPLAQMFQGSWGSVRDAFVPTQADTQGARVPSAYAVPPAPPSDRPPTLLEILNAERDKGSAAPPAAPAQEDTGRGLPMPVVKYGIPEDAQNDLAERLAKSGISLGSLIKLMGVMPQAQKPVRTPFSDVAGAMALELAQKNYENILGNLDRDPKKAAEQRRKAFENLHTSITTLAIRGDPFKAELAARFGESR